MDFTSIPSEHLVVPRKKEPNTRHRATLLFALFEVVFLLTSERNLNVGPFPDSTAISVADVLAQQIPEVLVKSEGQMAGRGSSEWNFLEEMFLLKRPAVISFIVSKMIVFHKFTVS